LAFEKFDSADITHIPLLSATTPVYLRCAPMLSHRTTVC
jgi:hypothetical protein